MKSAAITEPGQRTLSGDFFSAPVLESVSGKAGDQRGTSCGRPNGAARSGVDLCRLWNELLSCAGRCIELQLSQPARAGRPRFGSADVSRTNSAHRTGLCSSCDFTLRPYLGGSPRRADAGERSQSSHHRHHLCRWPAAGARMQRHVESSRRRRTEHGHDAIVYINAAGAAIPRSSGLW